VQTRTRSPSCTTSTKAPSVYRRSMSAWLFTGAHRSMNTARHTWARIWIVDPRDSQRQREHASARLFSLALCILSQMARGNGQ
jgi:hypothetical protein